MTCERANKAVRIIVQRLPRNADGTLKRGLSDDDVWPERCQQLVLGDNAPVISHEQREQIEDERLQRDLLPAPTQLPLLLVQLKLTKTVDHGR